MGTPVKRLVWYPRQEMRVAWARGVAVEMLSSLILNLYGGWSHWDLLRLGIGCEKKKSNMTPKFLT